MRQPEEEVTPLRWGEENADSLLNKTSQLLNLPPSAPTPLPQRPGKLTTCQGCRRDRTNSVHGEGGHDPSCGPRFLGGGSSAFRLVSVCIDLIGLIISAGTGQARLCAFLPPPQPPGMRLPHRQGTLCARVGGCRTPALRWDYPPDSGGIPAEHPPAPSV